MGGDVLGAFIRRGGFLGDVRSYVTQIHQKVLKYPPSIRIKSIIDVRLYPSSKNC